MSTTKPDRLGNADAFQAQQVLAYRQGRNASEIGRSSRSNPYTAGSNKADAWVNGWLDASQGLGSNGFQVPS